MIVFNDKERLFEVQNPQPEEIAELDSKLERVSPGELRWFPPGGRPAVRGLGDLVKKVTDFVGIRQCGGCAERQRWLNEKVPNPFRGGDST